MYNHESLVAAMKQVDVVISVVGAQHLADQVHIISAIKEAGTIKRFLPSEFRSDISRIEAVKPVSTIIRLKVDIRRAIKTEGIPYVFVSSNGVFDYFLSSLVQSIDIDAQVPPRDKVTIFGDEIPKAVFIKEEDVTTYTIRAVDDPRTLNKVLHMRPPPNTLSFNELVSLWEKKIGKTLDRTYIPVDELLKNIQEAPSSALKLFLSLGYSYFVRGEPNSEIDQQYEVEASQLYPDVKYTTIDEFLEQFV